MRSGTLERVREAITVEGLLVRAKGLILIWHDGGRAGDWLLIGFMMVLFWTLAVGLIIWAVRAHHAAPCQDAERARRILDERLARGEIDVEGYRARRDHLTAP